MCVQCYLESAFRVNGVYKKKYNMYLQKFCGLSYDTKYSNNLAFRQGSHAVCSQNTIYEKMSITYMPI